jgi:hypothetical protein
MDAAADLLYVGVGELRWRGHMINVPSWDIGETYGVVTCDEHE